MRPEGASRPGPVARARRWPGALKVLAALVFLNGAVSFNNAWPTAWIRPDLRLAPEFVALWVALLCAVRLAGRLPRRLAGALAAVYALLIVGRYADVTPPAWFGRAINLYWDAPQIPRFLAVVARTLEPWQAAGILAGLMVVLWGLYRVVRLAIQIAARDAVPIALGSRVALAASAVALGLVVANTAGVEATFAWVSRPVAPVYIGQARALLAALSPDRPGVVLPPSPAFDSDLAGLEGRDVKLLFLESYGAIAFDDPQAARRLAGPRESLARSIAASGRQVVSALVRSPTFGGASDLAHVGLLSGIDLSDPLRHDAVLASGRPTLLSLFHARGYETFGFYPAVTWEWPERQRYGFDRYLDGRDLDYPGPSFGFWRIPDQYAIARFDQLCPVRPDSPPRLLFFPTITSHLPFRPVPPYQPDWARLLSGRPYGEAEARQALADEVDWNDLRPAYPRMIEYTYTWLAGYLRQPAPRDYLLILIGDHQPVAGVTGPGAPWEVPVHLITSSAELVRRLVARGFTPELEPRRPALGAMHELTPLLLQVFDGAPPSRPRPVPPDRPRGPP
jgi:hypothetical protein